MGEEAGKLASAGATRDQDAIATQFAALGKSGCGGCHTTFRQKLD
jgi:cytochrome c556